MSRVAVGALLVGTPLLASILAGCVFDFGAAGWNVSIFRSSATAEERYSVTQDFVIDHNVTWREAFNDARGTFHGTIPGDRPFRVTLHSPQPFEADFAITTEQTDGGPSTPSLLVQCLEETVETHQEQGAVRLHLVRAPGQCVYHVNLTRDINDPGGAGISWGVENTAEMLERVRFSVVLDDSDRRERGG